MYLLPQDDGTAYLDPGTGAAVIGSIWALIVALVSAAVAFFVKKFWRPLKRMVRRLVNGNLSEDEE